MANLKRHGLSRKIITSYYVFVLYCVHVCVQIHVFVFSPEPQIALPLLGDIGVLLKVLCCYVRNYVLVSRKSPKGNLYQKLS